nr:MAG TPA: hypothetical protein [Caudoviricetes sp.]
MHIGCMQPFFLKSATDATDRNLKCNRSIFL